MLRERVIGLSVSAPGENEVQNKKTAVILAGGQSRRFGRDKSEARFKGKPLTEILINTLKDAGFSVLISGPHFKFSQYGLPIIEDSTPFSGPLHALADIFNTIDVHIDVQRILLVACDMPFITPKVIEALWDTLTSDIVLIENEEKISPLPGIYSKKIYPQILALISKKRNALKDLFQCEINVGKISEKNFLALDPHRQSLWNINTVDDLDRCEKLSFPLNITPF